MPLRSTFAVEFGNEPCRRSEIPWTGTDADRDHAGRRSSSFLLCGESHVLLAGNLVRFAAVSVGTCHPDGLHLGVFEQTLDDVAQEDDVDAALGRKRLQIIAIRRQVGCAPLLGETLGAEGPKGIRMALVAMPAMQLAWPGRPRDQPSGRASAAAGVPAGAVPVLERHRRCRAPDPGTPVELMQYQTRSMAPVMPLSSSFSQLFGNVLIRIASSIHDRIACGSKLVMHRRSRCGLSPSPGR